MAGVPPGTPPGPALSVPQLSAPGSQPVTLGGIPFWTSEAPADFQIGGVKQNRAANELVGGGKVVQPLGAQGKPFRFKGRFLADRVASQISALRQLCVLGNAVTLSYGFESWSVLIVDIQPTYKHQYYAEYEIEVEVCTSLNGVLQGSPTGLPGGSTTQDQQTQSQGNDLNNLNGQAQGVDPNGASGWQSALTQLNSDLAAAGSLAQLSQAGRNGLLNDVSTLLGILNVYLATQSPTSQQYLTVAQMVTAATLIARNVSNAATQRTITVQGGTLIAIASKYYKDPSQATVIQEVNHLSSMILPTGIPTMLVLPDLQAA